MDKLGQIKINGAGLAGTPIVVDVFLPIPVTKSIADIAEPQSRQGAYSKTITIQGNTDINSAFRHIYEINKDITNTSGQYNPDFNPNKRVEVEYSVGGIIQLEGYMRLMNIRKELQTSKIIYDCQIFDEAADFWKEIDGKTMADIDLTKYNHTLNYDAIRKSWDQNIFENGIQVPFAYGKGYVHGFINRRPDNASGNFGATQSWDVGDTTPMLYAKELVDAIYFDAGVDYDSGSFFNTDEFKRWVVPYNGIGLDLTEQVIIDNKLSSDNCAIDTSVTSTSRKIERIYPTGTITDPSSSWNGTTKIFTAPINGSFIADLGISFNVIFQSIPPSYEFTINISFRNLTKNTRVQVGNTLPIATSAVPVARQFVFTNVSLQLDNVNLGDELILEATTFDTGTSNYSIQSTASEALSIRLNSSYYSNGSLVNFEQFLNKDVKQKDFMLDLVKTFNLYIDLDEDGKHIVRTRDNYYSSDVVDLEPHLNTAKEVTYEPMGALNANPYIFDYKEDKDTLNEYYKDTKSITYGRKRYDVDNDFITNTKKIEVTYSPTVMRFHKDTSMSLPNIIFLTKEGEQDKSKKGNYRLIRYEGIKPCNQYAIDDGPNVNFMYAYPLIGHIDDGLNPTLDGLFGMPETHFLNPNIKYSNNTLFFRYHLKQYRETTDKNSKIVTGYFNISPDVFPKLNFNKLYYFDNSYFRINKIYDYKPYVDTKIEFIKVIEYDKPSSGSGSGNGGSDDFDEFAELFPIGSNIGQVRGNNSLYSIGDDNNLNHDSFAVGDNNFSGNAVSTFLSSSNNTILDDATQVTLINTDSQTITENGLYINGVHVIPNDNLTVFSAADQIADSGGTPKEIFFTGNILNGDSLSVSGNEITIERGGLYSITMNAQIYRTSGGSKQDFYMWVEGDTGSGFSALPNSARHSSTLNSNETFIVPMEMNQSFNSGDIIKFMFEVSSTNVYLNYEPVSGSRPEVNSFNAIVRRVL